MTVPIVLAVAAIVAFPLLKMSGIDIESSYIVGVAFLLGALVLLIVWRFCRGLLQRHR